jgi:hypothetical protein
MKPKDKIKVEVFGWIWLIGTLGGIWFDEYRWKLIFTGLFFISWSIILIGMDNYNQKQNSEEKKNE